MRAFYCDSRQSWVVGDGWRIANQAQKPALRPKSRARRRAVALGRRRGSPRPQPEAVDLADHSIAGNANLGGDLTTGQAGANEASQLIDTLCRPGRHNLPPPPAAAGTGRRGEGCTQQASAVRLKPEFVRARRIFNRTPLGLKRLPFISFHRTSPLICGLLSLLSKNHRQGQNLHDSSRQPRVLTIL